MNKPTVSVNDTSQAHCDCHCHSQWPQSRRVESYSLLSTVTASVTRFIHSLMMIRVMHSGTCQGFLCMHTLTAQLHCRHLSHYTKIGENHYTDVLTTTDTDGEEESDSDRPRPHRAPSRRMSVFIVTISMPQSKA